MVFRSSLGLQNFNIIPQVEDDLARPRSLVDLDQISPTFWGLVPLSTQPGEGGEWNS